MTQSSPSPISRRSLLSQTMAAVASVSAFSGGSVQAAAVASFDCGKGAESEILGQGTFRYRAIRHWGLLDRSRYPVKDCHGIAADRAGRIVVLTNDTHNNLIAYAKTGKFSAAWETRFPAAHGLEITDQGGEDWYWITDHDRQIVSVCTPSGRELRAIGPDALASKYPDLSKYHPTNTATLPDGTLFISDGYGSSFIHHFDPDGRYVSSFGGEGDRPENLRTPHSVWIDTRSGSPQLMVCDRTHEMLKWFSPSGELLRIVEVPGTQPCNVAAFGGRYEKHIAVASLNGVILILNGADRVVSVLGGQDPIYVDGKLQKISVFNYTFNHPHDIYVDEFDALYVAQWWSNQTYPIKLELVAKV